MQNQLMTINGYQISEQLYQGSRTIVYRAHKQSNHQPVIIKLMRSEYPSFLELIQFRNQYIITKNLKIPGIIHPYSLENYQNSFALIMEDFGGISLKKYMNDKCINISDFLIIAIQITEILDQLYQNRVIHKDIKPANILIDPDTKEVKLIDFSIASLLPKETQKLQNPNVLEGTLGYISPEQTGRMNRGVDYRSDFYALGVTFYELLTGKLPFTATDPMELIHAHIACNPPKVNQINPNIPSVLSAIIAKLMAKNAENRYQTALGLKHDLETCWKQWENNQKIDDFEIGCHDTCERFIIPEKLYGRDNEVQALLSAFDRIATPTYQPVSHQVNSDDIDSKQAETEQRRVEMMLVAGYSGIGKTAVINEVHKPIVRQRGYFISGKFDQYQRNIPFSALVQAFQDLIEQLLSENETQLQQWKIKILEALGESGQVIIDVIPVLKLIIGEQPPVPKLSGDAAQNRFNLLFHKFIQVFATQDHPLVIFLDDLQWVDSASLKFIQSLMSQNNAEHLLLIGAYRDNEVDPTHALMLTLEYLKKNKAIINTITLGPLNLSSELNPLVADTLHCSSDLTFPLSQLIYEKTKGNPFFVIQFLKNLYEEGLITFNSSAVQTDPDQKKIERGWQCDLAQVKLLSLTEDVVEFVANRLKKLNLTTQQVLQKAACIGNQFDLETLAIVHEKSLTETATDLWAALQEGFILPLTEVYKFYTTEQNSVVFPLQTVNPSVSYKFLHDRIQQASYSLIPDNKKQETHLKIGRLLLENTPESEQQEKLFEIVNQLNIGADLIKTQSQRNQLADLNQQAAQKAKASIAYKAGFEYAKMGLNLLPENSLQQREFYPVLSANQGGVIQQKSQYKISLTLHELASELASLCGEFEVMDRYINIVLKQAESLLDKITIYRIKIISNIYQNKLLEAISIALNVLEKLGVTFPETPTLKDTQNSIAEINTLIGDRKIEDLAHLPIMTDAKILAIVEIAGSIMTAAVVSGSAYLPLLIALPVKLSIQYGNTPASTLSYAYYGKILCDFSEDVNTATQFGQLALQVISKLDVKATQSQVLAILGAFIFHRTIHLKETLETSKQGYLTGLEVGSLEYAGYHAHQFCMHSFLSGKALIILEPEIHAYCERLEQLNQLTPINWIHPYWQATLNLLQPTEFPTTLSGKVIKEKEFITLLTAKHDLYGLYTFYLCKMMLCFIFGEIQLAQEQAIEIRNYLIAASGTMIKAEFYFYDSLVTLATLHSQPVGISEGLKKVKQNQEKLQKNWVHYAKMNHQHKFNLVEAERHRLLGNFVEAMNFYDQSIAGAKENEYIQEEALANELAAQFYLSYGKQTIAQAYLNQAYYGYARWGAKTKVEDLEKRYPELLKVVLNPNKSRSSTIYSTLEKTITLTDTESSALLDLTTVMKVAQAISSEVELEKLLKTLMRVTLENVGAQRGVLLLCQDQQWVIEAQAQYDSNHSDPFLFQSSQNIPLNSYSDLPHSIINYVTRTQQIFVLDDTIQNSKLANDPYILAHQPKSILVSPIINRNQLMGILYLENNLTLGAFSQDRVKVINILTTQAAISLENARLYDNLTSANQQLEEYNFTLEQKVAERTEEVNQKNHDLSLTLKQLQQTQAQLIQAEKLSGLGQMASGIAHEINNPIGFIYGNVYYAQEYLNDLLKVVSVYQQEYPNPTPNVEEVLAEVEIDFLTDDLRNILSSMKQGANRIKDIIQALRTFSRLDESDFKQIDLHKSLDSALLILRSRLNSKNQYPQIKVTQNYGDLPLINCYASQLNQVFFNILNNAIDSLEEVCKNKIDQSFEPEITICTEYTVNHTVKVQIIDNGSGIEANIQQKIFDPFFTTKPVGSGTGIGLSVAYSIIVEKHGGKLICSSIPQQMTEFIIEIPNLNH
ncbi:MAG: AAA family ATPase [Microcoleaceae cyanobacterium]